MSCAAPLLKMQAQLALMEVAWPEGLYEDSSTHSNLAGDRGQQGGMRTRSSKGKSKRELEGGGAGFLSVRVAQAARRVCVVYTVRR
jgi:hypothetical protein